ncbi:MAG: MOSC domain-containing protein [Gemmatimonadetes bacterium]|nr:MOSC domain-containing protein [Gemmatimonadota bacterium]NIQ57827.1 MOSC domain-containing protein [Gemmatimonadota bacterium]NIU77980.1 MOSC domain-containing protein [Gammaproteobacteria bacterium]NIX47055.1 MOSC domain-containing protein [Gemmatimonadota bacterium]NIY11433.1 MOSC domain-containing protein [Gemmatimonadota bacterium]
MPGNAADRSARSSTGRLEAIWVKRMKRGPMDPARDAELVADRGIAGNANQGGRRQVTVIARETWDGMMAELDADLDPAARRANLMVSGISLDDARGKTLHVGSCRIHLLGETRPCERMDEALPGLRRTMAAPWRGGAFGVVLDSGTIRVGDAVALREPDWSGTDPAPASDGSPFGP